MSGILRRRALQAMAMAAAGAVFSVAAPAPHAEACGGLFCNASQPVNQAAERILFVDNGDGTTTAVIEIAYEGPSERFAWVLPISDIADPSTDIQVSSTLAFDRLQQATNPFYSLNRRVEGECDEDVFPSAANGGFAATGGATFSGGLDAGQESGGVVVEASGSVGPFDYELISVTPGSDDPADVAVKWLTDNKYELGALGPDVLRPYLAEDMKLLAVRLTKGNDAGSVRPLSIRYTGDKPSIPIRPTAVAANDDMGIMVWVAGEARAVPVNYRSLTLNDALINWFNANSNYNDVVTAAADESGGQGFVTEFADDPSALDQVIYPSFEQAQLTDFTSLSAEVTGADLLQEAAWRFNGYDGFAEAVSGALTLTDGVAASDVLACPSCYLAPSGSGAQLDPAAFRKAIYEQVLRPLSRMQDLLTSRPYLTRLYTTMSADEMSMDPLFDFNADLDDLDNNHTADQVIECKKGFNQFNAPFRVELPSGLVVHGTEQGTWPVSYDRDTMPANLIIAQATTTGAPKAMVDNLGLIEATLSGASAGGGKGTGGTGGTGGSMASGGATASTGGVDLGTDTESSGKSGGMCAVSQPGQPGSLLWLSPLAMLTLGRLSRRKKHRAA